MIKNIIFDIGNIVAYYDFEEALNVFAKNEEEKTFIIDNIVNSPEWSGLGLVDIGLLSWDDIIKIIQDRTNNTHDELIEDYCHKHYNYLMVQESMLNLIKDLRNKGYKVYLLSNTNEDSVNYMKNSGLFESVDGYVLSYLENKVKPNQGIYKTLINRYNLLPDESIFIDDRLDNCETAKLLGMDAINANPNDYNDLITKLKEKISL